VPGLSVPRRARRPSVYRHLDASNNYAGFLATRRLERLGRDVLRVDAEGNRVSAEVLSVLTHGAGLCLSVGAAVGLLRLSPRIADGRVRLGVKVFAMSLLVLYTSSTAFHAAFLQASARHVLHVFDQCAIYVLICGTYFPIMAAVGTPAAAGALAAVATLGGVGIGLEVFCHAVRAPSS
jgi:predicted membrane channel-forming protein YqfA (hemolysin III family)